MFLALSGAAAAQFDVTEGRLLQCRKGCCENVSGSWDGTSGMCLAGTAYYNEYYKCDNACLEAASREFEPAGMAGPCCAPAFLMAGLAAMALATGRG